MAKLIDFFEIFKSVQKQMLLLAENLVSRPAVKCLSVINTNMYNENWCPRTLEKLQ